MLFLVLIPILLPLLGLVWLLRRRRYRGLSEGALLGLLVLGVGVWAVFQSRSSTGALGLLPLPLYASLAGTLGWAGSLGWHSPQRLRRGLGTLALGAVLLLLGLLLADGLHTRARNQESDAQMAAQRAEIEAHRAAIRAQLARHPGEEGAQLDALSHQHAGQRTWLLPLLEQPELPQATLERLAKTEDAGLLLAAIRHPRAPATLLERVYRESHLPDYFFSDLARHPNTPPALLRELYHRPRSIMHLDRQFAANPALPAELRRELLAQTRDVYVLQGLLGLPELDCSLLPALRQALARSERPDDEYSQRQLQALGAGRCAAAAAGAAQLAGG
ncbi:hypothetical protein [Roseateles sp.]|jgi:hypothetical protein|uniref:hypothetical protein n=1 Tax=Roseateles sp. TaxID=1971397 RepID=UPI0037C953E5